MNNVELKQLIKTLIDLLGPLSANLSENITFAAGRYDKPEGFRLYVGVEGDVQYEDPRGVNQTRHFVVGYHPVKMKAIIEAGTAATDLAACFG